jgi:hypothetical protein
LEERDLSKFVRQAESGPRLYVKMVPRSVYVEMVTRFRGRPEVIDEVADAGFWLWDLDERQRQAAAEGRETTRGELADEIMAEMDDREWWATIAAFEERLITQFPNEVDAWSDLLDPVYDLQEREGWRERQ